MMTKKAPNNLLISFIIPCYNAADSIAETIESINKQKTKLLENNKVEIIIVDDASDDNNRTLDICKSLVKNNSNVRLYNLSNNIGQAEARNEGMSHAKGKYIGFIDADDIADPLLLASLEKYIDENYDVILWGLYEEHYDNKKRMVQQIDVSPDKTIINGNDNILRHTVKLEEKTLLGYLWNKLYKKEILKRNKIKLPNEHLVEDELFNIEYFKNINSLFCINKALYHYKRINTNGDTVTSSYLHDYFPQYSKRIQTLYDLWNENKILNDNSMRVLANEYTRFSMSAIWRNSQKESKMNKQEQKHWIKNWYKNDLTIKLLSHAKPEGKLANIYLKAFNKKNIAKLLIIARIIDFSSKHMSKILIRARQSR